MCKQVFRCVVVYKVDLLKGFYCIFAIVVRTFACFTLLYESVY